MSRSDFERRLAKLGASPAQGTRAEAPPRAPGPSGGRDARLDRALGLLAKRGIRGAHAYSPIFAALRAVGLGPRPLHYWSAVGLFVFAYGFLMAVALAVVQATVILGETPRPVRAMLDLPLEVNLGVCAVFAAIFAAIHKIQAISAGLPRWRDL